MNAPLPFSAAYTQGRRPLAPWLLALVFLPFTLTVCALEKPDLTYQIYQFPQDQIPRIDGDASDWAQVPNHYVVGMDQLTDDKKRHPTPDPGNLDVRVRVGWVKGLNRLYFLYEAFDNYWDFSRIDLHNDTFEVVVDGDASGGPLIDRGGSSFWTPARVGESASKPDSRLDDWTAHWAIHGVHAQNYHIFTPPGDKDWCLAWGAPTWIKNFPWANAACRHKVKPGEAGHLVLEFWITPFDYAGPEGPARAVESELTENKIIGLAWAVMDYDDVAQRHSSAFWNLSPRHSMYGHASELCAFRLMPLEGRETAALQARWSWRVADMSRRLVEFTDQSSPGVIGWHWDFGDGNTSTEQHPRHCYASPGDYIVTLEVQNGAGKARHTKIWDIQLK